MTDDTQELAAILRRLEAAENTGDHGNPEVTRRHSARAGQVLLAVRARWQRFVEAAAWNREP